MNNQSDLLTRIEAEIQQAEFHLRNASADDPRRERWLGYVDALKWVIEQHSL